jgi:hypothetical protein
MAKTQALNSGDLAPIKPRTQSASRQRGVFPSADLVPMQFRMSPEFVTAFKIQAATQRMKLNELLKACFDAFMSQSKQTL